MHGYGHSAAPVLENEPFQHGVVEAPATVDPVHGAVVHERHEPAAAEAEREVGALQAGIVLPEVEIVRGRVVADLPDVGHDGGETATARDEGALAVVNLRGAIKSDLGRGEPQRKEFGHHLFTG
jgi:hypothetical protein